MKSFRRTPTIEYVVIGLLDPEHRLKIGFYGFLCGAALVVVLTPLFTDLFQALALRSPSEEMREWGPLVAGIAAAFLVVFAGVAAGAPTTNSTAWWQNRKVRVTAMLFGLGLAIGLARFSKGVATIQRQRLEALQRARGDLEAARRILTESDEAKSILSSIREADRLIALGTRKRFPKIRQHGFRLRSEARQAQLELKEAAGKAIAEAEARFRVLPPPYDIPTGEVLRVIAGPALTELVFAELGAVVMAFWASFACAPIRRRRKSDLEAEVLPRPAGATRSGVDSSIQEEAKGLPRRHWTLAGVDCETLDPLTRHGLDEHRGEWFGVPLSKPARRREGNRWVLRPVLDVKGRGGRAVFVGSKEAYALLPPYVVDELRGQFEVSNEAPDTGPPPGAEKWSTEDNEAEPQNGDAAPATAKWQWAVNKDEEPN